MKTCFGAAGPNARAYKIGWKHQIGSVSAAARPGPGAVTDLETASDRMRSDLAVDAAQTHTTTGQQFFSVGKFAEARIEFEAAFALTKEPDLLFNVALSWEREGSVREAIAAYERYLLARPTDADTRAKVERMRKAVALPTPQNPDGQKPKPRLSGRAVTGITVLSVGLAALAACVVTGSLTEVDRQSLGSGTLNFVQAQDVANHATTTRALSIAFGTLGGVGIVAGVPLLVWR